MLRFCHFSFSASRRSYRTKGPGSQNMWSALTTLLFQTFGRMPTPGEVPWQRFYIRLSNQSRKWPPITNLLLKQIQMQYTSRFKGISSKKQGCKLCLYFQLSMFKYINHKHSEGVPVEFPLQPQQRCFLSRPRIPMQSVSSELTDL